MIKYIWTGFVEEHLECPRLPEDTEDDAKKRMGELLIERIKAGEVAFIVWEDARDMEDAA